jgi:hypothetical protein
MIDRDGPAMAQRQRGQQLPRLDATDGCRHAIPQQHQRTQYAQLKAI